MILKKIIINESGQGLIEYSLIVSLTVIVAISAVIVFGKSAYELYETIKEDVTNAL